MSDFKDDELQNLGTDEVVTEVEPNKDVDAMKQDELTVSSKEENEREEYEKQSNSTEAIELTVDENGQTLSENIEENVTEKDGSIAEVNQQSGNVENSTNIEEDNRANVGDVIPEQGIIKEKHQETLESQKKKTNKGFVFATCLSAVVLFALCVTLIIQRDRDNKIEKTVNDSKVTELGDSSGNADDLASNQEETPVITYPPCDVTLGEYKGLSVTVQSVVITEEEIQEEIDYLLSSNQSLVEITDRTEVQSGDVATIDYVGTVDGVEFEGGSDTNVPLTIGSSSFIEGFEEQIIGHKVGENFDINVTFPSNYSAELAGKAAVFNITVQSIGYYVESELNDEFIAANTEYNTVEEFKTGTYDTMLASAQEAADSKKDNDILNAAVGNATFDNLSTEELKAKEEEMIAYYESYASYYSMDLASFASAYFGMDEATFYSEMTKAAELQVKTVYFLKKIIEVEGLTLSEQEYTEGLTGYAQSYGFETNEEFENYYGKEVIEENLLSDRAFKIIVDSANVINE